MIDRKKDVSASFGVFLTTFLIIGTVIIFAVLIFLSYQTAIDKAASDNIDTVEMICAQVDSDLAAIFKSASEYEEIVSLDENIDRYLGLQFYVDNSAIAIVDSEGTVLYSNHYSFTVNNKVDELSINALNLNKSEDPGRIGYITTISSEDVIDVRSCVPIDGTEYYCIVSRAADISAARSEYFSSTLLPACVAMLCAIALFVGFTQLMIRPMKDISRVMARAGEGDFSARVDKKYTNYDDMNSIVISADLQELSRNVNSMIEKLENQESDRNIFISSVAHDIRTPLTSINGFITAMLDGTIPADQQDKYLNLIKQEVDRIRKLITSMTEASSLSHTDPELMEEFDLREVVNDVIMNLEPQLREKEIEAKAILPEGDLPVFGEAQQLCRVIVNIVSNAIKFTPVGGKIHVTATRDDKDRKMIISIADSGPGVEKEKRSRVFESFYKTDPSRKQEGFGLGLYICKQILQGHGQTIVLEESRELGGAEFIFAFPYPPEKE